MGAGGEEREVEKMDGGLKNIEVEEKKKVEKEVDDTINEICKWVKKNINEGDYEDKKILPEITKALAELISARAAFY